MNGRIPRFMLLVVLVVSMLGAFSGGIEAQGTATPDEQRICGEIFKGTPTVDPSGTSQLDENGVHVLSVFTSPTGAEPKTLMEIELDPEAVLSISSPTSSTILRVAAGSRVNLVVCSGEPVLVQLQGDNHIDAVEAGNSHPVGGEEPDVASAIYIAPGTSYYVVGEEGARITATTGGSYIICSKGGC